MLQLLAGVSWQIEKGIKLGHIDSLWAVGNIHNAVACANFSLLHANVESWHVLGYEGGPAWEVLIQTDADAVARHAGLRYFESSAADAVSIAEAHLVIGIRGRFMSYDFIYRTGRTMGSGHLQSTNFNRS